MQVDVWAVTHASQDHDENEDRTVVGHEVVADAATVEHHRLATPVLLAALDGLGGHRAGHVASHLAAKLLAAAEAPSDESAATTLIGLADRTLHDAMQTDPEQAGMGATVALVSVQDERLVVANVGDTMAWRQANGDLEVLTVSDRLAGSQITQCLGATGELAPHVRTVEAAVGDRVLLASDGLTDVVDVSTIARTLAGPVDAIVPDLYALVEAAQFPDDVTILLAEFTVRDSDR